MDEIKGFETGKQEYTNITFSAGVLDDPVEDVYLKIEPYGEEPRFIVLQKKEALTIIWLLSGALWSHDLQSRQDAQDIEDMEDVIEDFYNGENIEDFPDD